MQSLGETPEGLELNASPGELPEHLSTALRNVLFYIMPRVSPDRAEAVLTTGRYLRSTPRDTRQAQQHSY